jgi:hypothetical protein
MVANLHQFEEVQDPGPDPHASEKSNLDPHQSKRRIRINQSKSRIRNRIKVMRIRDTVSSVTRYFLFFNTYRTVPVKPAAAAGSP